MHCGLVRNSVPSVHAGEAPTQQLGRRIYGLGIFQGLISFAAVDPTRKILVVFPKLMGPSNLVSYTLTDTQGRVETIQIPEIH